jgi:hypothetical protein
MWAHRGAVADTLTFRRREFLSLDFVDFLHLISVKSRPEQ